MSLDTFERTLLTELRHHVAARAAAIEPIRSRPPRRRWTVAVVGGGLASAAAAAAIVVGLGVARPSSAYAVESRPDGDVVVTVHDLSDAAGLRSALAAKGVRAEITYVPGFQQAAGGQGAAAGSPAACDIALAKVDGALRFTLTATQIAGGATLDIVTSGSSPTDVGSPVAVTWEGGAC